MKGAFQVLSRDLLTLVQFLLGTKNLFRFSSWKFENREEFVQDKQGQNNAFWSYIILDVLLALLQLHLHICMVQAKFIPLCAGG